MYTAIATNMERAAEKAMTVETRGSRPGADRAGMQDRTRKLTDTRPHRTARIQKLCVTWI